jgi:heme/copper-type cytochrome/quinol oxidase subunit 2|tara:strand:- start:184 stop:438 length:255 start_codon:yes stop_codon:yes gene_type:complete
MMKWLPENVSTFGSDIDSLFYIIYYITVAIFVFVTVLLVFFIIMYRQKEGRRAVYSHGNFGAIPVVHRGTYEYSSPEVSEDYLP